jgi:hypothetical protein
MKFIYTFFFLILLSCSTTKKEYVCGDHPCIDKKEFNEYFSKNLTIEIKPQENKKKKNVNLVNINTDSKNVKKKNNKNSKKEEKIKKKNNLKKLNAEKTRLSKERKIKKKEEKRTAKLSKAEKLKEKNKKKIKNKISNNRNQVKKIIVDKKPLEQVADKSTSIDLITTESIKSLCEEIKDCDIDKITELLIKKGKDKPYPNITSN